MADPIDQIAPSEISRIDITPPHLPGTSRGWGVAVWRQGEERVPDEGYACSSPNGALRTVERLFAGEKVRPCDYMDLPPPDREEPAHG